MTPQGTVSIAQPGLPVGALFADRFTVADVHSPVRAAFEAAIRRAYGEHFGARVAGFMPHLVGYRGELGQGVLGYRAAGEGRLYLENYLELPVESMLSQFVHRPVERRGIVEVGQFAVDDRRIVGPLFMDLVPFLRGQGFRWICFTATHRIRRLLERAGLVGLTIATARAEAVRDQADEWGSYYDNDPLVVVGRLDDPRGGWCAKLGHQGRVLTAVGV